MFEHTIFVTTGKGLTPLLERELIELGYKPLAVTDAGLRIKGTWDTCIELNIKLRTAQRVLFQVGRFQTEDPDEFYRKTLAIPWEKYLRLDRHFSVHGQVKTRAIKDDRFAFLKCKDAISDRFRSARGQRPDSGSSRDEAVVFVYWQGRYCDIYLDTSGDPLNRRGYRPVAGRAPMQENLAAGLIMASGWKPGQILVNPMCGSGTIAIEAAQLSASIPPGHRRRNYAFNHYRDVPLNLVRKYSGFSAQPAPADPLIIATDNDPVLVDLARNNARRAGVEGWIDFAVCDLSETIVPEGPGVILVNPPYGERLKDSGDLGELYTRIGDFMKNSGEGKTGAIVSGNTELLKKVGLRSSSRSDFYNGNIPVKYYLYDLYSGSRKAKYRE